MGGKGRLQMLEKNRVGKILTLNKLEKKNTNKKTKYQEVLTSHKSLSDVIEKVSKNSKCLNICFKFVILSFWTLHHLFEGRFFYSVFFPKD